MKFKQVLKRKFESVRTIMLKKPNLVKVGRFLVKGVIIVGGSVYFKGLLLPAFAQNTFEDFVQGKYDNSSMSEFFFNLAMKQKTRNLLLIPLFKKDNFLNKVQLGFSIFSIGATSLANTDFARDRGLQKVLFVAAGVCSAGSYVTTSLIDGNMKEIDSVIEQFNQKQ